MVEFKDKRNPLNPSGSADEVAESIEGIRERVGRAVRSLGATHKEAASALGIGKAETVSNLMSKPERANKGTVTKLCEAAHVTLNYLRNGFCSFEMASSVWDSETITNAYNLADDDTRRAVTTMLKNYVMLRNAEFEITIRDVFCQPWVEPQGERRYMTITDWDVERVNLQEL